MEKMFQSLLLVTLVMGCVHGVSLPGVCTDIDICPAVFGANPVDQIKQCYDYETQTFCCATCKNLIGALGNTDPDCPWGNGGDGVSEMGTWKSCGNLNHADCSFYCVLGTIFRANCCQTCHEVCQM